MNTRPRRRRYAGAGEVAASLIPTDITGLALWLDASDLTTLFQDSAGTTPVTADGDVIGRINDKGSGGNNATQGTTASKPLYKTGIINNLSVARFAGEDDYLNVADVAALELNADSSVFVVIKPISLPGAGTAAILAKDAGGAAAGAYYLHYNSAGKLVLDRPFVEAGVASTNGMSAGTAYVVGCIVNGTAVAHFLNGAANGTDTLATGTATDQPLKIATINIGGLANFAVANVGEIVIYNAVLSAGQRQQVESYLLTKWGL